MTDHEEFKYLQRQCAEEIKEHDHEIVIRTDIDTLVAILSTFQVGARNAPSQNVSDYLIQLSAKLEDKFLKDFPATRKLLNYGWRNTMDSIININKL